MDDLLDVSSGFQLRREAINVFPTGTDPFSTDILVKAVQEVGAMGPNYRWGPEKTIELLNVVQRWEAEKEGQPKGSRKWQWVAAQLFVPDEECDLLKLSKRCERRVALLRTNYESYFYQRMLIEGPPDPPPSPIRLNAAVWEKMMDFFGESKIISRRPRPQALLIGPPLVAATVLKSRKENKADDDQDSEDEAERAIDQPEESSSSSVGSNHSYQGSTRVFLPISSTGSSYYDISGSDGHTDSSQGLSRTTARTFNTSSQSFGSSGHYSSEGDISLSKTVSESSSLDVETSITLGSSSDYSHSVPHSHGQTSGAVGSVTGTASFSSPPVPQTAISRLTDHRSLFEDSFIPSCVSHSAAALAAARLPPFEGSDQSSSTKSSSDSSSTSESKSGSVCCSLSKYCDAFCSCGGFSSGEKSTSHAMGTVDRKQNSRSSDPSMLGDMGSRFAQDEVKDKPVVMAAAAGEAGYGGPSERGGTTSPKTPGAGMVFYDSDHREYVRQLPASFAGLSLNHPPSPAAAGGGSGDDQRELINELAKFMCDDKSSESSSKEHPHAQEIGSQSRKPSTKGYARGQESGMRNRRLSPSFSASSRRRDPSSSPEPSNSSSSSILDSSGNENLNLLVYIKLNNLKLSEPG